MEHRFSNGYRAVSAERTITLTRPDGTYVFAMTTPLSLPMADFWPQFIARAEAFLHSLNAVNN